MELLQGNLANIIFDTVTSGVSVGDGDGTERGTSDESGVAPGGLDAAGLASANNPNMSVTSSPARSGS